MAAINPPPAPPKTHIADLIEALKARPVQFGNLTLDRLKALRDHFGLPDLDAAASVAAFTLQCLSGYIDPSTNCISLLCPDTRREIQLLIR